MSLPIQAGPFLLKRSLHRNAVWKDFWKTQYFQVGNRCLIPEILAGRLIRQYKAWLPEIWVSVLQKRPNVTSMAEANSLSEYTFYTIFFIGMQRKIT